MKRKSKIAKLNSLDKSHSENNKTLEGGLKFRAKIKDVKSTSVSGLPFDGKVVMAKKKKPEEWPIIIVQGFALFVGFALLYFAHYYPGHFHFYVNWAYAHFGHSHAQHVVGQKLLRASGVDKNEGAAVYWLKYVCSTTSVNFGKAADQGHPEASYNLAVAHLKGVPTHIKTDKEVELLLQFAAGQNLTHAERAYSHWCANKPCG